MSKATTAFVPYAPLNELNAVAAHVWIVDARKSASTISDAGAEALLRVRAFLQNDPDKRRGVAPDLTGLTTQPLRRPVGIAPVARGHVLAHGRMLAIGGRAHMSGNALAAVQDFDRARGDARPNPRSNWCGTE